MFSFLIFSSFSPRSGSELLKERASFIWFVCQSYACLFEIHILYYMCDWCVLVEKKKKLFDF